MVLLIKSYLLCAFPATYPSRILHSGWATYPTLNSHSTSAVVSVAVGDVIAAVRPTATCAVSVTGALYERWCRIVLGRLITTAAKNWLVSQFVCVAVGGKVAVGGEISVWGKVLVEGKEKVLPGMVTDVALGGKIKVMPSWRGVSVGSSSDSTMTLISCESAMLFVVFPPVAKCDSSNQLQDPSSPRIPINKSHNKNTYKP